jgi:hypothetical protein
MLRIRLDKCRTAPDGAKAAFRVFDGSMPLGRVERHGDGAAASWEVVLHNGVRLPDSHPTKRKAIGKIAHIEIERRKAGRSH